MTITSINKYAKEYFNICETYGEVGITNYTEWEGCAPTETEGECYAPDQNEREGSATQTKGKYVNQMTL